VPQYGLVRNADPEPPDLACQSQDGKTARMQKFSLDAIVREQAKQAVKAPAGRSAETVYGGHERALRQTVLALTAASPDLVLGSPLGRRARAVAAARLGVVRLSWNLRYMV
jgi:hypothetical protein